jgi:hypothetical protein
MAYLMIWGVEFEILMVMLTLHRSMSRALSMHEQQWRGVLRQRSPNLQSPSMKNLQQLHNCRAARSVWLHRQLVPLRQFW